jgi:phosphonate transport system substrate-binding protein
LQQMNSMRILLLIFLVALSAGCRQRADEVRTVDFSNVIDPVVVTNDTYERAPLQVAVAAILSPRETFSSYEDLLRYIGDKMNVPVEFHQRRTYREINNMIEKGHLDFAFICSGGYVELDVSSDFELLAVPVSHGKTVYQSYIIVPSSSPARDFSDLKGASFAYTDLLSNSGYFYPLYRIVKEDEDPADFFSSTIFTNAHDVSIQMVARGLVEGAAVSSLVFDYLKTKEPDRVRDIRVIEISHDFGIPPIVASARMDDELKMMVRDLLKNLHNDTHGRELIDYLLIDRFTDGSDADYDGIREMKAAISE